MYVMGGVRVAVRVMVMVAEDEGNKSMVRLMLWLFFVINFSSPFVVSLFFMLIVFHPLSASLFYFYSYCHCHWYYNFCFNISI